MVKYRIEVDEEKCIGCGACEAQCPENFEIKDDSKAKPKNAKVSELKGIKEAAEVCPVDAIKITEVD